MKDYLIVVDANFPERRAGRHGGCQTHLFQAGEVRVRHASPRRPRSTATPIWTQAGATTLAYKGVAEEMRRYEPKRWQEAAKERKDVAD